MNKVISMNLNGNAYQLEESGYSILAAYLSQARARLTDNPDCEEIMADLEQAVADKFERFLTPHKSVLTEEEVKTVIAEMGPVEGDEDTAPAAPRPKQLYRIKEGSILGGVATGLAAYLGLDVVVVRIAIAILTILSHGGLIFGYLLAWVFIPEARTEREQARATGTPFTAEELITRAKTEYAKLDGKAVEWKQQWRDWRKEVKRQARQQRAWARQQRYYYYDYHPSFVGEILWLIVLSFAAWYGYHHVEIVHDFLDAVWTFWHQIADRIAQFIMTHKN
jgi:phage shock protein PspC (stress-responsive transcriptional regulator)